MFAGDYAVGSITNQFSKATAGVISGKQTGKSFLNQIGGSIGEAGSNILGFVAANQAMKYFTAFRTHGMAFESSMLGGRLTIANPILGAAVGIGVPLALSIAGNILTDKIFPENPSESQTNSGITRKEFNAVKKDINYIKRKQNLRG